MIRATTATLIALLLTAAIGPIASQATIAQTAPTVTLRKPVAKTIPAKLLRQIQQDIKNRYKVPIEKLNLVAARKQSWNGCMGVAPPDRVCIEIAISGWQTIISGPNNRFWIYNISNDGKSMAFNLTASLPQRSGIPVPRFVDRVVPPSEEDVLFQSAMMTGEAISYDAVELKADGENSFVLTRRQLMPNTTKPKVIKRLTKTQVQPFLDLLNNNSFSHFNRISYFNSGAVAVDAPVFQLYGYGMTTEYTAGDEDKLPPKLGAIVRAWEKLVR